MFGIWRLVFPIDAALELLLPTFYCQGTYRKQGKPKKNSYDVIFREHYLNW